LVSDESMSCCLWSLDVVEVQIRLTLTDIRNTLLSSIHFISPVDSCLCGISGRGSIGWISVDLVLLLLLLLWTAFLGVVEDSLLLFLSVVRLPLFLLDGVDALFSQHL